MQTTQLPSEPLAESVAREIRARLGYLGINQAELARRMGVSAMWVSTRLRPQDAQPIDLAELERIAAALATPVSAFLPTAEPTPGGAR